LRREAVFRGVVFRFTDARLRSSLDLFDAANFNLVARVPRSLSRDPGAHDATIH